jgi:hypothetical protein
MVQAPRAAHGPRLHGAAAGRPSTVGSRACDRRSATSFKRGLGGGRSRPCEPETEHSGLLHSGVRTDRDDCSQRGGIGLAVRAATRGAGGDAARGRGVDRAVGRRASGLTGVLDELRELARGLHPSALADGGPRPALKALARTAAPEPIALAAYHVVSEALTNTAKHAHATVADVRMAAGEGVLRGLGPRRRARRRRPHRRHRPRRPQGSGRGPRRQHLAARPARCGHHRGDRIPPHRPQPAGDPRSSAHCMTLFRRLTCGNVGGA